jgi:hypothetical protein
VKSLIIVVVALALSPLSALLYSWMLSTAWGWFLVEYGPGPSYKAWYGIAIIWALLSHNFMRREDKDVPGPIERAIAGYIVLFLVLGIAGMVRLVLGWA